MYHVINERYNNDDIRLNLHALHDYNKGFSYLTFNIVESTRRVHDDDFQNGHSVCRELGPM